MKTTKFLATCALALASGAALAQAYPSRPIKFLVPFSPGSGTDIIARTVGEAMGRSMGQPVLIENKPGAGGTIGAAQVAKSDPDGHTILVHSSGHALNPALYPSLPYDTVKDLTGVTPLASVPNVMVVSPSRGWWAAATRTSTSPCCWSRPRRTPASPSRPTTLR